MNTALLIWYNVSTLVLALLLYKPVMKLIFVKRVRRAERKLGRDATEDEKNEINRKTFPFTIALVIFFSLLFNYMLMGKLFK